MVKKRRKKKKLKEKKRYESDGIWSRSSTQRAGTIGKDKKQLGGKEIQKILGLWDEGPLGPNKNNALSMMDIVMQTWRGEDLPDAVLGHGKADPKGPPEDSLNNDEDDEEEYD